MTLPLQENGGRSVSPTEVAVLVHSYLQENGWHRALEGLRADAAPLLAPVLAVRRRSPRPARRAR